MMETKPGEKEEDFHRDKLKVTPVRLPPVRQTVFGLKFVFQSKQIKEGKFYHYG